MKVSLQNILFFVFILFFSVCYIDPANSILGISKTVIFVLVITISLFIWLNKKIKYIYLLYIGVLVLLPIGWGLLDNIFGFEDYDVAILISQIKNYLPFTVVIPLSLLSRVKIKESFSISLNIFLLFYCLLWAILLLYPSLFSSYLRILKGTNSENYMIVFGFSELFHIPGFLHRASSALIFLFTFSLFDKKYMIALVSFLILFLSCTKANLLTIILILIWWLVCRCYKRLGCKSIIAVYFIICLSLLICIKGFIVDKTDESTSIKTGHMISYCNEFSVKPVQFILGSGYGTSFYSIGRNRRQTNTELSYFELVRHLGLIVSIVFMIFLAFPLLLLMVKSEKALFISYLAYLFIGGTNPLLLGSTGLSIIAFIVAWTLKREN